MPDEKIGVVADLVKEPTQLRIDVAILHPEPRAIVTFRGVEYPVLSLMDLLYPQMMEILGVQQAKGEAGQSTVAVNVQKTRKQLQALVPTLSDEILDTMTYREIVSFIEAAMESGTNPQ